MSSNDSEIFDSMKNIYLLKIHNVGNMYSKVVTPNDFQIIKKRNEDYIKKIQLNIFDYINDALYTEKYKKQEKTEKEENETVIKIIEKDFRTYKLKTNISQDVVRIYCKAIQMIKDMDDKESLEEEFRNKIIRHINKKSVISFYHYELMLYFDINTHTDIVMMNNNFTYRQMFNYFKYTFEKKRDQDNFYFLHKLLANYYKLPHDIKACIVKNGEIMRKIQEKKIFLIDILLQFSKMWFGIKNQYFGEELVDDLPSRFLNFSRELDQRRIFENNLALEEIMTNFESLTFTIPKVIINEIVHEVYNYLAIFIHAAFEYIHSKSSTAHECKFSEDEANQMYRYYFRLYTSLFDNTIGSSRSDTTNLINYLISIDKLEVCTQEHDRFNQY